MRREGREVVPHRGPGQSPTLAKAGSFFYCAMQFSAKRGIEIAYYRLSVCPSVCNVGGSGSHTLQILETKCTDN